MTVTTQDINLNPKGSFTPINIPDCYIKIADIAFYKSENKDFKLSHHFNYWREENKIFNHIAVKTIHH
ncbi:MAG: hypothetical protein ACU83U_15030 [Gammaproteobacteria bacterium]